MQFEPKNHIYILTHFVWGTQDTSPVLENTAMRVLLLETVDSIAEKKGFVMIFAPGETIIEYMNKL